MSLTSPLGTATDVLLLVLLLLFATFCLTLVPAYFVSLRPRRGTTEWMKRLDAPKFAPLAAEPLRRGDIAWAILSAVCAAVLCLITHAISYFQLGRIELLTEQLETLLVYSLAPIAVLSVSLYLLLRPLFGRTFPAVCAAILTGLVQTNHIVSATLVTLSLLLLWVWVASDADAPIFPRAILFASSVAALLVATVWVTAVAWLAPLYLAAYVYVQIHRWRRATKHPRGVGLAVSLLLLFFLALAAVVGLWVLYCSLHGQRSDVLDLRLLLTVLPQKLTGRLHDLVRLPRLTETICRNDLLLLLLGLPACVPVVHGLLRRRDSRCIVLLASLACFAAMWIFGGVYLPVPMFLPIIGRSWSTLVDRKYSGIMTCYAVGLTVVYLAVRFQH